MANEFLMVKKDLFKLGLNPTELLVLSQVMEYTRNTGDCFMSNKTLADNFGVSEKTISRTVEALEKKGFIERNTISTRGGKVRHMLANTAAIDAEIDRANCV